MLILDGLRYYLAQTAQANLALLRDYAISLERFNKPRKPWNRSDEVRQQTVPRMFSISWSEKILKQRYCTQMKSLNGKKADAMGRVPTFKKVNWGSSSQCFLRFFLKS